MAIEISSYSPPQVLTNEQLASKLLTPDALFNKLGVRRRFIADEETVLDMAVKAMHGLETQVVSPNMVFFSTSYPDGVNNASELIKHFKYEADGCCNIHAASSGFGVALARVAERRDRFADQRILIAASEKYSPTLIDLTSGQDDPGLSQAIFSDGATVMEFTDGEDLEILSVANYSFPADVSTCLRMPIDYSLVRHPALVVEVPASKDNHFQMEGTAVYKAFRDVLPSLILEAIRKAKIDPQQIRMVIPHQASKPMVDLLSRKLPGMDVYQDLEDGNWSSASIPYAMDGALGEGAICRGDKVVLAAFGAGLYASISVVQLN